MVSFNKLALANLVKYALVMFLVLNCYTADYMVCRVLLELAVYGVAAIALISTEGYSLSMGVQMVLVFCLSIKLPEQYFWFLVALYVVAEIIEWVRVVHQNEKVGIVADMEGNLKEIKRRESDKHSQP